MSEFFAAYDTLLARWPSGHRTVDVQTRLEIVEPGLVQVHQWRPDGEADPGAPASIWCAIGRKA